MRVLVWLLGACLSSLFADAAPDSIAGLQLVDPNFRPVLSTAPGIIIPLADGRIFVGGASQSFTVGTQTENAIARLNSDGTLDTSFRVPDGTLPAGTVQTMFVQPDGRLVVKLAAQLVRLSTGGAIDTTFHPDAALTANGAPFQLADGRWISVNLNSTNPITYVVTVQRYATGGNVDTSFAPLSLFSFGLNGAGPFMRAVAAQDAQNRLYLAIQYGNTSASPFSSNNGNSRVFRLNADGSLDSSFKPLDLNPVTILQPSSTGLIVQTSVETYFRPDGWDNVTELFRLRYDGTDDPSFTHVSAAWHFLPFVHVPTAIPDGFNVMAVAPDGSVIARSIGRLGHFGLVRFGPDGKLDSNFAAELGADASLINQIVPLASGQILVAGTFTALAGVPQPYLARLNPDTNAATTYLRNISARGRIGNGDALIAGFITSGGDTTVLARGAGPALTSFNVPGALADPQLGLFSNAMQISSNDDWGAGPAAVLATTAAKVGAFPFASGSADAASVATAPTGSYTVQITAKNPAQGVVLAEIYDAGPAPIDANSPRLINFSARATASAGSATMIAGFIVGGQNARNYLIRAVGPGLARFNVASPLVDPVLTLFRANTAIASNDDWSTGTDTRLVLREAFNTVGAFPLDYDSGTGVGKDAALLISLTPGSYTVEVAGKNGGSGTALVEIYEVP